MPCLTIRYPKPNTVLNADSFIAHGSAEEVRCVRGLLVRPNNLPIFGDTIQDGRNWLIEFTDVPAGAYLFLVYDKEKPHLVSTCSVVRLSWHAQSPQRPAYAVVETGALGITYPYHFQDCTSLVSPLVYVLGTTTLRPLTASFRPNNGQWSAPVPPVQHNARTGNYVFQLNVGNDPDNPYSIKVMADNGAEQVVENLHVNAVAPHE
ncbi:MAG: hypothetical protein NZO58_14240 [Gemmataceae bacterium]|nr:hypothetical protein [Gemmataceae bacterium]